MPCKLHTCDSRAPHTTLAKGRGAVHSVRPGLSYLYQWWWAMRQRDHPPFVRPRSVSGHEAASTKALDSRNVVRLLRSTLAEEALHLGIHKPLLPPTALGIRSASQLMKLLRTQPLHNLTIRETSARIVSSVDSAGQRIEQTKPRHRTCAVVGSGPDLRCASRPASSSATAFSSSSGGAAQGWLIDRHDAIFRSNSMNLHLGQRLVHRPGARRWRSTDHVSDDMNDDLLCSEPVEGLAGDAAHDASPGDMAHGADDAAPVGASSLQCHAAFGLESALIDADREPNPLLPPALKRATASQRPHQGKARQGRRSQGPRAQGPSTMTMVGSQVEGARDRGHGTTPGVAQLVDRHIERVNRGLPEHWVDGTLAGRRTTHRVSPCDQSRSDLVVARRMLGSVGTLVQ